MMPLKDEPLVMVRVWLPRLTRPMPKMSNRPATDAPAVVCEMSSVALPAPPGAKMTTAELAIEPLPLSARVVPRSICVALV